MTAHPCLALPHTGGWLILGGMRPDLRADLLRRAERDQEARRALDADATARVDADNLPWLKEVVAASGWPGRSLTGEDGAHAAWLLVQHADRDPQSSGTALTCSPLPRAKVRPPRLKSPI